MWEQREDASTEWYRDMEEDDHGIYKENYHKRQKYILISSKLIW